jgi:hypothetical protein
MNRKIACTSLCIVVAISFVFQTVAYASSTSDNSTTDSPSDVLITLNKINNTSTSINDAIKASTKQSVLNNKSTSSNTTSANKINSFKNYLQTKTMTQDDLNAFNWSFVISQFAMPFDSNLSDALQSQEVFKTMTSNNTIISSNPYSGFGGSAYADSLFSNKTVVTASEFSTISETILDNLQYMPVFDSSGTAATVGELYNMSDDLAATSLPGDTYGNTYYFKDIIWYYGDTAPNTSVTSGQGATFLKNQEPYLFSTSALNDIIGDKVHSVELSQNIFTNSDITNFYLELFLQNYLKYMYSTDSAFKAKAKAALSGSTTTSSSTDTTSSSTDVTTTSTSYINMSRWFMSTISDYPVLVDSYGDLVYNKSGTYVMLYPNYANPLFSADTSNTVGSVSSTSNQTLTGKYGNYFTQSKSSVPTLSTKSTDSSGYFTLSNAWNWIGSKSTSSLKYFISNEKLMMYNKAIATVYSQDIQPNSNTTATTLSSTSGTSYISAYLDNTATTDAYRNSLIFVTNPAVNHILDTSFVESPATNSKKISMLVPYYSNGEISYHAQTSTSWKHPQNSNTGLLATDMDVWINNFLNPVNLWAAKSLGKSTALNLYEYSSGSWTDVFLDIGKFILNQVSKITNYQSFDAYTWLANATDVPAVANMYNQRNYTTAYYSASDDYVWWATDYKTLKNLSGTNEIFTTKYIPTSALDYASDWDIFTSDNPGMFVPRQYNYLTDGSVFTGSTATPYRFDSVYYKLRDNRVSDEWINYSKEDVSILSFVWLNYYLPEMTYNKMLSGSLASNIINSKDSYYSFQYSYNGNKVATSSNVIDSKAILLPYAPESLSSLFQTEVTTCYLAFPEGDDGTVAVNYNPYTLLLGLYKNTDSDLNASSTSESTVVEVDTLDIMEAIANFIKNPVTTLGNIFSGFFQSMHNWIAVGKSYSVLNFNWLFSSGMLSKLFAFYYYGAAISMLLILIKIFIDYALRRDMKFINALFKCFICIALTIVPQVVTLFVVSFSDVITDKAIVSTANKAATIETEVRTQDTINADEGFETEYQDFKEQFSDVTDTYSDISIKQLKKWNKYSDSGTYKTVTLKDLCDNVSYVKLSLTTSGDTDEQLRLWYDKDGFVPVHWTKYSDNLYYYFYDWLKYQYLNYYKTSTEACEVSGLTADDLKGFTNYASQFTGMGTIQSAATTNSSGKTTDSFVSKVYTLEQQGLVDLKGGVPLMYNDANYVYGPSASNSTSYGGYQVQDLFGLGYLFKMDDDSAKLANTKLLSAYSSPSSDLIDSLELNYLPLGKLLDSEYYNVYSQNSVLSPQNVSSTTTSKYYLPFSSKYVENSTNGTSGTRSTKRSTIQASYINIFNALGYKNSSSHYITTTPLESKLCKLNSTMYSDIYSLISYHSSEVTDDTWLKMAALVCTFDFNQSFGTASVFKTGVSPTGFTDNSVDLDKIMRVIYAGNISDIVDDENLMYMLYEKQGGLLLCILVFTAEIFMVLCSIIRTVIVIAIFILLAVLCLYYYALRQDTKSRVAQGALVQIGTLWGLHALSLMTLDVFTLCVTSGGTLWNFVYAILMVLIYFFILKVHIYLLKALFVNWRNLGYNVIADRVSCVTSRIRGMQNPFHRLSPGSNSGLGAYSATDEVENTNVNESQDTSDVKVMNVGSVNINANGTQSESPIMDSVSKNADRFNSVLDDMVRPSDTLEDSASYNSITDSSTVDSEETNISEVNDLSGSNNNIVESNSDSLVNNSSSSNKDFTADKGASPKDSKGGGQSAADIILPDSHAESDSTKVPVMETVESVRSNSQNTASSINTTIVQPYRGASVMSNAGNATKTYNIDGKTSTSNISVSSPEKVIEVVPVDSPVKPNIINEAIKDKHISKASSEDDDSFKL